MDGTLVDDMQGIGTAAARVIHDEFGTPLDKALIEYYSTTGMPFEVQLRTLYPKQDPQEVHRVARLFHDVKVAEVYASAKLFPEVPKLLKDLEDAHWILVVATGAEREMADLIFHREGVSHFFAEIMGSGEGTKDRHLREFIRERPDLAHVMVGDAEFDMKAARGVPGFFVIGRATTIPGWAITPGHLKRWGADWADYSLAGLPQVLEKMVPAPVQKQGDTPR
jgi:phosphoglycolate phosphatase-like HAD superfamily hydrolase